ncbi:uncharacterized protein LOC143878792 [Tasmannia lanceolata]|uniref:uncharacterized protein LOC143878792 n=1 Tax=Tasmannia lanceolata TaxID=3420 RepID=UPI0040645995
MSGMNNMTMPTSMSNTTDMPMSCMSMMQMTFYWSKDVVLLFSGWPGHSLGMYILSLFILFILSFTMEWLSGSRFIKPGGSNRVSAGFLQTGLHVVSVCLSYVVMLAVMSFNVGVLVVVVTGHAVGFLLFRSSVLKPVGSENSNKDLCQIDDTVVGLLRLNTISLSLSLPIFLCIENPNPFSLSPPTPLKKKTQQNPDREMDHGMTTGSMAMPHKKMMMHMTFFWGKDVEILFHGWPGHSLGMYFLALFFIFTLSVMVEWISGSRFIKLGRSNRVQTGLFQTGLHALRMGLAYMVMLAVMSFNAGVLIVAVAGHAVGFLVFGSCVFKMEESSEKPNNQLPPIKC